MNQQLYRALKVCLKLRLSINFINIMSTFLRPSYKMNYYPETATIETSIFPCPPGYEEDVEYIDRLLKPLYGMPLAARAWHTTMSAFFERKGCETVGFEKGMCQVVIDG